MAKTMRVKGHLHFTEKDANRIRINPLRPAGLSPFIDTVSPIIESVSFKEQKSGTHFHPDSLHDSIDVVVRVYDPRVDTTGAGAGRGMGIYKIQYEILDTLKDTISGAKNSYQFDSLPKNSTTAYHDTVYHDSSDWENGIFYYWATNTPFADTADQYWNTKQHKDREWFEPPAESIEVAKFKDGYFYVKIKSWDICRPDTNSPDSELIKVHVDNFRPKVKEKHPENWKWIVANTDTIIWCTFSEPMDMTSLTTVTSNGYEARPVEYFQPLFHRARFGYVNWQRQEISRHEENC